MVVVEIAGGQQTRKEGRTAGEALLLGLGAGAETTARIAGRGEVEDSGVVAEPARGPERRLRSDLDLGVMVQRAGGRGQVVVRQVEPGAVDRPRDLGRDVDAAVRALVVT